jgi:uncharacterized protein (TIGR02246 family)
MLTLLAAAVIAAATPACEARIAEARPTIDHANHDWLRAMKAGDAAAIAKPYAEDGLFVLPDGEVIRGRAAVEALYAAGSGNRAALVGGGVKTLGLACAGQDLIHEWGEGEVRTRGDDGAERVRKASYLTVWRKIGGDWRIVRNLAF